MTQNWGKYFHNTEILGIFVHQLWALTQICIRIHHHQVLGDACDKYDYGVA